MHFESEMDEIVEADSMKTIKTRSIVLNSPQNINSKLVLSTPKIKSKPKVEKTPAKKGFKKCCNCTIFWYLLITKCHIYNIHYIYIFIIVYIVDSWWSKRRKVPKGSPPKLYNNSKHSMMRKIPMMSKTNWQK